MEHIARHFASLFNSDVTDATFSTQGNATDDGRTGCKPYLLGTDCNITYAQYLGKIFTATHIIYALVVVFAFIFTLVHAYKTIRLKKGFKPFQSVQVRLYIFILIGMLLLTFRIIDPFGWRAFIPFQVILLSYDLSGTMTLSLGLDIVFDWLRVVSIAGGQLLLSNKFRYVCIALQLGTLVVLMCFSLLQSFVGPWWLFHSLKTSVYILVSSTMLGLFLRYGFRVQKIIKDHEDLHKRHTTWKKEAVTSTKSLNATPPADQNAQNQTPSPSIYLSSSFTSISSPSTSTTQTQDSFYPQSYPSTYDSYSTSQTPYTSVSSSTQPIAISGTEEHIFQQPFHNSTNSSMMNLSSSSTSFLASTTQPLQNSICDIKEEPQTQLPVNVKEKAKKSKPSAGQKVPKLIIIVIFLLAVSLLLWAYVLYQEISHQCTVQNSCNLAKDRVWSLLAAAAYDLVHLAAYVAICLFFGIQKNPDKKAKKAPLKGAITRLNNRNYARLNDDGNATTSITTADDGNNVTVVGDDEDQLGAQKPTTRSLFPRSSLYSRSFQRLGSSLSPPQTTYIMTPIDPNMQVQPTTTTTNPIATMEANHNNNTNYHFAHGTTNDVQVAQGSHGQANESAQQQYQNHPQPIPNAIQTFHQPPQPHQPLQQQVAPLQKKKQPTSPFLAAQHQQQQGISPDGMIPRATTSTSSQSGRFHVVDVVEEPHTDTTHMNMNTQLLQSDNHSSHYY